MNIRPASDLKYKYSEIENLAVNEDEVVYLTKNGYGSMVVLSLDAYSKLIEDVEYALDAADNQAKETDVRYTHEEMFSKLRGTTNG